MAVDPRPCLLPRSIQITLPIHPLAFTSPITPITHHPSLITHQPSPFTVHSSPFTFFTLHPSPSHPPGSVAPPSSVASIASDGTAASAASTALATVYAPISTAAAAPHGRPLPPPSGALHPPTSSLPHPPSAVLHPPPSALLPAPSSALQPPAASSACTLDDLLPKAQDSVARTTPTTVAASIDHCHSNGSSCSKRGIHAHDLSKHQGHTDTPHLNWQWADQSPVRFDHMKEALDRLRSTTVQLLEGLPLHQQVIGSRGYQGASSTGWSRV